MPQSPSWPTLIRLRHMTPAAAAGLNAASSFSMYASYWPVLSRCRRNRLIGMLVMLKDSEVLACGAAEHGTRAADDVLGWRASESWEYWGSILKPLGAEPQPEWTAGLLTRAMAAAAESAGKPLMELKRSARGSGRDGRRAVVAALRFSIDGHRRVFPQPERCRAVDSFLACMRSRFKDVERGYRVWVRNTR